MLDSYIKIFGSYSNVEYSLNNHSNTTFLHILYQSTFKLLVNNDHVFSNRKKKNRSSKFHQLLFFFSPAFVRKVLNLFIDTSKAHFLQLERCTCWVIRTVAPPLSDLLLSITRQTMYSYVFATQDIVHQKESDLFAFGRPALKGDLRIARKSTSTLPTEKRVEGAGACWERISIYTNRRDKGQVRIFIKFNVGNALLLFLVTFKLSRMLADFKR